MPELMFGSTYGIPVVRTASGAMTIRTLIFWLHLTAGVVAGSVVLVMSVTGVLLTYEKQMVAWAERSPLAAAPSPGAPRLPVETLIAKVREVRPSATPATVTVRADCRRAGHRRRWAVTASSC